MNFPRFLNKIKILKKRPFFEILSNFTISQPSYGHYKVEREFSENICFADKIYGQVNLPRFFK